MLHKSYTQEIVRERVGAAERIATVRRQSEPRAESSQPPPPVAVRFSGPADAEALEDLAGLDSRRLPRGSFLIAEVDGAIVAAAPLHDDVVPISDPFRPTAEIRELLAVRARQLRDVPVPRRWALPRTRRTAATA